MEDKVFELLEKMYSDLTGKIDGLSSEINGLKEDVSGLKEDVSGLKEDVSGLKEEVSGLKGEVKQNSKDIQKIQIKIENDITPKLDVLFDEVASIKEKQLEHDQRFDSIESKIEFQDVEIKVLKRVK